MKITTTQRNAFLPHNPTRQDKKESAAAERIRSTNYTNSSPKLEKRAAQRLYFESELRSQGFKLEIVTSPGKDEDDIVTRYTLIHAPFNVLCKTAEEIRLRKPIRVDFAKPAAKSAFGAFTNAIMRPFRTSIEDDLDIPSAEFIADSLSVRVSHAFC